VRLQTIHYLSRPHSGIPRQPVGGPAAWLSKEHADEDTWTHVLSAREIDNIEAALRASKGPLRELRRETFALPTLSGLLASWRTELSHGRGFLRIRGVPVSRWTPDDVERFFWALGCHLGVPGAQNSEGHLLGHVRDERLGLDSKVRQYRTREAIPFHCDAADVVGLLCLKEAKRGGQSRVASSVAVFDRLFRTRPELVRHLFEQTHVDTRGDGGVDSFCVSPAMFHDGKLRTFYHGEYFRTVTRYPGIPALSDGKAELLDAYDALASSEEFHLEMTLAPGDVQLISNHTILHSRSDYVDHESLDERRHLLRLWLSIESSGSTLDRALRARSGVMMTGRLLLRMAALRRSRQ